MSWLGPPAAFVLGGAIAFVVAPVSVALAREADFYDVPVGYKRHWAPTPYLGGLAVFVGFVIPAAALGGGISRFGVVVGCAATLLVIGTLDDRFAVPPVARVLAELAAGGALYASGHGWGVFSSDLANVLLTLAWVVGLVNAFNLMDNLDGATGTVAGVAAAAAGTLAAIHGDLTLSAFSLALAGACAGFLPHNLAGPARIFLGDGGSMPVGFLVSAVAIGSAQPAGVGRGAILVAAMLVGLAILDTTLVVVSRRRARLPVVTAGRDHLTHRLLTRLGSPQRVAGALGGSQAALCGLAIAGAALGSLAVGLVAFVAVAAGVATIAVLESPSWRPARAPVPKSDPAPSEVHPRPEHAFEPLIGPADGR